MRLGKITLLLITTMMILSFLLVGYKSVDDPREETYIEGYVTDSITGEPISNGWVEASYSRGGCGTSLGIDGYYDLNLYSDETYYVIAEAYGYESGYEEVLLEHGEVKQLDFALIPINLTCLVYGTVLDAVTMEPVDCVVYLRDLETDAYVKTNTDVNGYYEIDAEPGFYTVYSYSYNADYLSYESEAFELSDGEEMELNIYLEPIQQWVFGLVVDEYGDPLKSAYVYIDKVPDGSDDRWYGSDYTGEDGLFNISAPDGEYIIKCSCENYKPYEETIVIEKGTPLEYNVVMESVFPSPMYQLVKWIFALISSF